MSKESFYRVIKFPAQHLPEQYQAMLESRFLRSLRNGNEYFALIQKEAYYSVYRAYFRTLLARPEAVVRLSVIDDDNDIVLGWSLMEPDKLHYVHVNNMQDGEDNIRGHGMGSILVPETFSVFTHITKTGMTIWNKKYPEAVFNPFG